MRLERLLAAIDAHLDQDPIERARLRVPQAEGRALAQLESRSVVISRKYVEDEMVEFEVDAPESLLRVLKKFRVDVRAEARKARVRKAAGKTKKPSKG
jgi:50S ribosomal subunit-associated GTPase HflX